MWMFIWTETPAPTFPRRQEWLWGPLMWLMLWQFCSSKDNFPGLPGWQKQPVGLEGILNFNRGICVKDVLQEAPVVSRAGPASGGWLGIFQGAPEQNKYHVVQKGLLSCGQTLLKVVYQTTAETINGKKIMKIMTNNKNNHKNDHS